MSKTSRIEQEGHGLPDAGVRGMRAIDRAVVLLALILESDAPRGLASLAAEAGVMSDTASRMLDALARQGLVRPRGSDEAFTAGLVPLRFAGRFAAGRNPVEAANGLIEGR